MTDDCSAAVERFLDDVGAALREYDRGYADADATLRVVRTHLADLEAAAE